MSQRVDLAAVLATFTGPWSPRTAATLNDYDLRVVKTKGEFTRHSHPETDEVFLVLAGSLTIRLDGDEVALGPGQLYVVPRGVHHQPVSIDGAEVLLIEPSETVNTGDSPSERTADRRLVSTSARPCKRRPDRVPGDGSQWAESRWPFPYRYVADHPIRSDLPRVGCSTTQRPAISSRRERMLAPPAANVPHPAQIDAPAGGRRPRNPLSDNRSPQTSADAAGPTP